LVLDEATANVDPRYVSNIYIYNLGHGVQFIRLQCS
jgi:hypothetical protein